MPAQPNFAFDYRRTLSLVTGALFNAQTTWRTWLPESGDWRTTALTLTVPVIVAALLAAWVIGLATSNLSLLGMRPTLVSTLWNIVGAICAVVIASIVFSTFAGMFGGRRNFALGFAALSLTLVPAYAGQALSSLPWIGGLIALVLAIVGLVQLWRIIPLYLEVPQNRRGRHYVLSMVVTVIVTVVISAMAGPELSDRQISSAIANVEYADNIQESPLPFSDGILGGLTQRAEQFTAAQNDRYAPPADGKLTEAQVRDFTQIMDRVGRLVAEETARIQQLSERVERSGDSTAEGLAAMMQSVGNMSKLSTAEMEMVKAEGGNWAEHRWIRDTLRAAVREKHSSPAVAANFALYQQYQPLLDGFQIR